MRTTRRDLIQRGGVAAAALALPAAEAGAAAKPGKNEWSFVHLTDTHIQPEMGAAEGVARAFAAIRALPEKPAFALVGGDIVMDANKVTPARADAVYDLWRQAADSLKMPLYYSIGNHDAYGPGEAATPSARAGESPEFGKKIWMKRLGLSRTYDTFEHRGWRFLTLDSFSYSPEGAWEGVIDDEQLKWVDDVLRRTDKRTPVVFLTHVPVMTLYGQYTGGTTAPLPSYMVVKNGKEFFEMIRPYDVRAVFQGHTHVVEECRYLNTRYITGGAVCGDWWKGKRLGVHPEGFSIVTVKDDDLSWRYVPYGWNAAAHQKG